MSITDDQRTAKRTAVDHDGVSAHRAKTSSEHGTRETPASGSWNDADFAAVINDATTMHAYREFPLQQTVRNFHFSHFS